MPKPDPDPERELRIARVLRPLGRGPLTRAQAERAGQLLAVHPSTVYRLRARFLRNPATSTLKHVRGGPRGNRLRGPVETVVADVVETWLPKQRHLAHPVLETYQEVKRRCRNLQLAPPARNTVAQRIEQHRAAELALLAAQPAAEKAPGSFGATWPLEIVQIDHTLADVLIVDRFTRRVIGRPWVSVAIDLATRSVPAFFVGLERPGACTVALLLSRVVQPKDDWLTHLGLAIDWPMHGIPQNLHLDNATEFHSRALRSGCAQYGIEIMYRPVGRPHYGGHVERMNRTLMQRLKGLPGATGNTTRGRKQRKPEDMASLTLTEFERWLALEVGQRYHRSEHRGLHGGTPYAAWATLTANRPPRRLPPGPDEARRLLIRFMPMQLRTIQPDGLTIFYIRYWHPVFIVWREQKRRVRVRYHPEDLSRVFVSSDGANYVEASYADLRRPSISLWEQRAVVKHLRAANERRLSEELVFRAIGQQRRIVEDANRRARQVRAGRPPFEAPMSGAHRAPSPVDYSKDVAAYPVEIWHDYT